MNGLYLLLVVNALAFAFASVRQAFAVPRHPDSSRALVRGHTLNLLAVFVQTLTPPGPWLLAVPSVLWVRSVIRIFRSSDKPMWSLLWASLALGGVCRFILYQVYPFASWHGVPVAVLLGAAAALVWLRVAGSLEERVVGAGLAAFLEQPDRPTWVDLGPWFPVLGELWTSLLVFLVCESVEYVSTGKVSVGRARVARRIDQIGPNRA
ncbi:MAG: hypothetical protein K6T63_01610 [Alicyclobacillus herbarius]|uniref:hypothetical protein n=1 Tax=Alicyclobacillus herbarius TaxID=122960 RepID=UPI000402FD7F|nr:hypothetical protein [Alicyclobacillus herbarius]MCL6631304.1 hypothetical protein [Alicyclobacillus herbarius]